jgi:hypothetical protein
VIGAETFCALCDDIRDTRDTFSPRRLIVRLNAMLRVAFFKVRVRTYYIRRYSKPVVLLPS